ncbi:MAG: PHP domain-containing protein [Clostridia bacterium]|nr:PHP domain-containing protein [Clostridia bacterium]
MDSKYLELTRDLNHENKSNRLESLQKLVGIGRASELPKEALSCYVNNHIHTFYSFSPYSPSKAIWMAYKAGLATAGIIDHDSVGGLVEFIEAGKIAGIATTVGMECRVDFSATSLKGKKLNNPDQESIGYVILHGIPHSKIGEAASFIKPFAIERNKRNQRMVNKLNTLLDTYGIAVDFEKDVMPLSMYREGGSITERHISLSVANKIIQRFGRGQRLVEFLVGNLKLNLSGKIENYLLHDKNEFYEYDLVGVIKGELMPFFYIDACEECPPATEFISFAKTTGAVATYAYLGDVSDSVTGDKRPQKFEDDYIEILFDELKALGFHGFSYMPSRNTLEQLNRVKELCDMYELLQISGEDINSPRQGFICEKLADREFEGLVDSTWALIGHEKAATRDFRKGMFSEDTIKEYPSLEDRIQIYKKIGQN